MRHSAFLALLLALALGNVAFAGPAAPAPADAHEPKEKPRAGGTAVPT